MSVTRKITKSLFWLLALIVLLEVVLQLASLFVREDSRAPAHWLTGNLRVLALGDSNTYGLYLPAGQAYPAQLETSWNAKHPEYPIEVINLGYPGTNSFRLLDNLPELLDSFRPDVVLIMIGFNDFWTPPEQAIALDEAGSLQQLLYKSRLYKLVYMASRKQLYDNSIDTGERRIVDGENAHADQDLALSDSEVAQLEQQTGLTFTELEQLVKSDQADPELREKIATALKDIMAQRDKQASAEDSLNTVRYNGKTFSLGINSGEPARHSKQLEANLRKMITLLEAREVEVFLLNYPTHYGYYTSANKKIARLAEAESANFIELSKVLPGQCSREPKDCPELLFYDAHATGQGNSLVVEAIVPVLEQRWQP